MYRVGIAAPLLLIAVASFGSSAAAQAPSATIMAAVKDSGRQAVDTARDADRKPAESIAFAGVKSGDKVLELIASGGYFTRILSKVVGPSGHVYATIPDGVLQMIPNFADTLKAIAADPAYSNVTLLNQPAGAPSAPVPVDEVLIILNYHDLHNPKPFGTIDIPSFNKAVYASLKPGGAFVVIDHATKAGAGLTQTGSLHRIDPETVKAEVMNAGFTFDGQSEALHRPSDDYSVKSNDKDDQFIFRFRKPK